MSQPVRLSSKADTASAIWWPSVALGKQIALEGMKTAQV